MNVKLKSLYYKLWIYLPIVILIGLITFIYVVYTSTFLIPLISDNYAYDQSIANVDDNAPTLLLTMKKLTMTANVLVETFGTAKAADEEQDTSEKGWIYFGFLHAFLFFMLAGFARTVVTDPGRVPKEWNEKQDEIVKSIRKQATEEAVRRVLETERLIHSNLSKHKDFKNEEVLDNQSDRDSQGSKGSKGRKAQKQSAHIGLDVTSGGEEDNLLGKGKRRSNGSRGSNGSKSGSEKGIQKGEANLESSVSKEYGQTPTPEDPMSYKILRKYADAIEGKEEEIFNDLMTQNKTRHCAHCNAYKPLRTHHCRQCNACTLKMDHHCPWVNNCVGFRNYKYFMIMLIYSVFSLWFVWITYTEVVGDCILNQNVGTTLLFVIVMMYMLTLTLAIVVTLFAAFHFWLIYEGKTTLEYCEKSSNVKYQGTAWDNFKSVFGTNYLLWPFPLGPNYEGDGLNFVRLTANKSA